MCETGDHRGEDQSTGIKTERGVRFYFPSERWSLTDVDCGLLLQYKGRFKRDRFIAYRDIRAACIVRLPLRRRDGVCLRVSGDPRASLPELGISTPDKHVIVAGAATEVVLKLLAEHGRVPSTSQQCGRHWV